MRIRTKYELEKLIVVSEVRSTEVRLRSESESEKVKSEELKFLQIRWNLEQF